MNVAAQYGMNILIWLDQGLNTLAGGDPDETVSSRLGKIKVRNGGTIPRYRLFSRFLDWGLDKIDPGHSIDAIEHDEGGDAILDTDESDESTGRSASGSDK